jgi:Tfp pilus assembly protein PilO
MEYVDSRSLPNMLTNWDKLSQYRKLLEEIQNELNMKIRVFMKEHGWKQYKDDITKINVTVDVINRQDIDREKLKQMLTDVQYRAVSKTTSYEKMTITTPEMRDKLNKVLKDKKV